ncbi:MAG TPA: hypothetical protein VKT80_07050, partial [Chloroflexota bacterium]|nr:hypothetical protein [Chloroflexota bacterium]
VVGVLGGDLMKEAGQIPAAAGQPLGPGGTPPVQPIAPPTPTPPPAPSFSWYVTGVQTAPNCGTTYMTAYARNADGSGRNGITIKSWNDYGNVFIASTRNSGGHDGYWDRVIHSGVQAGKWYAEIIDGAGNQASDVVTVNFTGSCDPSTGPVQQVEIDFQSH